MKGYYVSQGYMGYVSGEYRLFSCEGEYIEYMEEDQIDDVGIQFEKYAVYQYNML